jgi:hypothetical protein
MWTINDGPAKAAFSGHGQQIGNQDGETAEDLVRQVLNENLSHTQVIRPCAQEFASAMPEGHRKGEMAYHVKAFRGSKEGMSLEVAKRRWLTCLTSRLPLFSVHGNLLWV